jgi:hypothetical protein
MLRLLLLVSASRRSTNLKNIGGILILLSLVMPTYYTVTADHSIPGFLSRMTSPLALLLLISGAILLFLGKRRSPAKSQ